MLTEYVLRGGSGGKQGRIELVAERDAAAERLAEVTSLIERVRFALAEQRGTAAGRRRSSRRRALGAAARVRLAGWPRRPRGSTGPACRSRRRPPSATGSARPSRWPARPSPRPRTPPTRAKAELETAKSRPRPILDVSARESLLAELEAAREREVEARLQLETARERVRAEEQRTPRPGEAAGGRAGRRGGGRAARRHPRAAGGGRHRRGRRAARRARTPSTGPWPRRSSCCERAEAERASQNEELVALRRDESALRERLQAITENVHGLEMQIYEKKLHLSSLLERAGAELGLVEDVLVAEYGPDVPVPVPTAPTTARPHRARPRSDPDAEPAGIPFDRAAQQRRLAKAERKFAQLGRVNPLALEEFAALEQRHKFLTEQLTDLTNTRKDLLDDHRRDRREDAGHLRERLRRHEGRVRRGVPGAVPRRNRQHPAHRTPTTCSPPASRCTVKPAGKKIERLSLLSGGERSLAAVALLIAIFKARPSPFYIMDEVEAALDDANLGRLLHDLRGPARTSQLIVITHQKRTMEIADALYGVSMRQDGVSAVVGQRVAAPEEKAG